jgi:hypothetical protein
MSSLLEKGIEVRLKKGSVGRKKSEMRALLHESLRETRDYVERDSKPGSDLEDTIQELRRQLERIAAQI